VAHPPIGQISGEPLQPSYRELYMPEISFRVVTGLEQTGDERPTDGPVAPAAKTFIRAPPPDNPGELGGRCL
jgi:hypothetical protein